MDSILLDFGSWDPPDLKMEEDRFTQLFFIDQIRWAYYKA